MLFILGSRCSSSMRLSSSKTLIKTTKVYVMQHCLATGKAKLLLACPAAFLQPQRRKEFNILQLHRHHQVQKMWVGKVIWKPALHSVWSVQKSLILVLWVVGFQQWVIWKSKSTVWTSPPSSSILYDHITKGEAARIWDKLFSLFYYLHTTVSFRQEDKLKK